MSRCISGAQSRHLLAAAVFLLVDSVSFSFWAREAELGCLVFWS